METVRPVEAAYRELWSDRLAERKPRVCYSNANMEVYKPLAALLRYSGAGAS